MAKKSAAKMQPAALQSVVDELKKVSWPKRTETVRLTLVVIIICLIIGAYIGIIDVLLAKGLDILTKLR